LEVAAVPEPRASSHCAPEQMEKSTVAEGTDTF
jgi:hypothetical protein